MELGLTHPPESQGLQETSDFPNENGLFSTSISDWFATLPDGINFADYSSSNIEELGFDIPDNGLVDNGNQMTLSVTRQGTPQGLKRSVEETGFDREDCIDSALSGPRKKQRTDSQGVTNDEDKLSTCSQPVDLLGPGQFAGASGFVNPTDKTDILDNIPTILSAPPSLTTGESTGLDRQIWTGIPADGVVHSLEGVDCIGTRTAQSTPCVSRAQTPTVPSFLPGALPRNNDLPTPSSPARVSADDSDTNAKNQERTDREESVDSLFEGDIDMSEDIACEESSVDPTNYPSSNGYASSENLLAEQSNAAPHANVPPAVPISTPLSLPKTPATFQNRTQDSIAQKDNAESQASAPASTPISAQKAPAAFRSGTQNFTAQKYNGQLRASAALAYNHAIQPHDVVDSISRQLLNTVAPPDRPIQPYPKHNGPLDYLPSANNLHVRSVRVGEERLVSRIDDLERKISNLEYQKRNLIIELRERTNVDPTTGKSKLQTLKDDKSALKRRIGTMEAQLADILLKNKGLMDYITSLHAANNALMQQCYILTQSVPAAPGAQQNILRPSMPVSNGPGTHSQQVVAMNPAPQTPETQPNTPRPPMPAMIAPGPYPQPPGVASVTQASVPGPQVVAALSPIHTSMGTSVSQAPIVSASIARQPIKQTAAGHPLGPADSGLDCMPLPRSQPAHAPNSQQTMPQRQQVWSASAAGSSPPVTHPGPPVSHVPHPAALYQPQQQASAGAPMGSVTCAPVNPTAYFPQVPNQMAHPGAAAAQQNIYTAAPSGPITPGFVNGLSFGPQALTQAAHHVQPGRHQQFPVPGPGPVVTTASDPANPVATSTQSFPEPAAHFGAVQSQTPLQAPVPTRPHSIANQRDHFTSPVLTRATPSVQQETQTSGAPNPETIDLTNDQVDGAGEQQYTPQQNSVPERPASSSVKDFYKSVRRKNYSWLGNQNHAAPGYRYQPPTYVPPAPRPKSRVSATGRRTPAKGPTNGGRVQKTPKRAAKQSPKGSEGKEKAKARAKAVSPAPEPANVGADELTPEEQARRMEEILASPTPEPENMGADEPTPEEQARLMEMLMAGVE